MLGDFAFIFIFKLYLYIIIALIKMSPVMRDIVLCQDVMQYYDDYRCELLISNIGEEPGV